MILKSVSALLMLLMTYMFRRLEIIVRAIVLSAHRALSKSYSTALSSVYFNILSEGLCDLTNSFGLIIPCNRKLLQFSNNKACSHRHTTAGLFYWNTHISQRSFFKKPYIENDLDELGNSQIHFACQVYSFDNQ